MSSEMKAHLAYKVHMQEIKKEEKISQIQKEHKQELENKKKNWFDPDYVGNLVNLFL
jgi:hypothetical protein